MFGGGVAVFRDGSLLGGDGLYYYVGEYRLEGKAFVATIRIAPFIEGAESVFKTVGQEITLRLLGSLLTDTSAIAQGYPENNPEMKFGAKLTKRAEVQAQ